LRGVTEEPIPPLVELRDPADLASFNPTEYRPDFWLVNGRAFPDTVLPGKYTVGYRRGSAPTTDTLTYYPQIVLTDGRKFFAPRQPVQTYVRTGVAEKVLVRMINMGFEAQPMHFHGTMPSVVGKDTFAWVPQPNSMFSTSTDERKRFFTLGIFSGETYDLILAYPDKSKISPIYANVLNNPQPNPFSPWETTWGNLIPAVAGNPPVPVAQVPSADDPNINVQGFKSGYPLFYLWHEHDDYKVTNNGVYPGGAVVLVRVDKDPPESTTSIPKHLIPS
jgi:hypothetical protein